MPFASAAPIETPRYEDASSGGTAAPVESCLEELAAAVEALLRRLVEEAHELVAAAPVEG